MDSTTAKWLEMLDKYYLSDFIKSGGAAFKLVLAQDSAEAAQTLHQVRSLAQSRGFVYVTVSAAETRIDKIDAIFFEVAKQIDWTNLITHDAMEFLRRHDYQIPEGSKPGDISTIARANGITLEDMIREVRQATYREIVEDRRMCKEFRTAIAQMRLGQFFPRSITPTDTETISAWLRGEKLHLPALRNLRIYSRIARHNAREMLIALSHWLATSFGLGLVIGLDLSALICPCPMSIRYTRNTLLDAYEVMRQFIDETDDITHCLVCAVAPEEIETDVKRSIFTYYALQSRLLSDVHDKHKQNYLGAMVRLQDNCGEGVSAHE